MPYGTPEGADDRFRGVVRILGCALQRRVFSRADGLGQRQLCGPEADETQQPRLLLGCGRTAAPPGSGSGAGFELPGEPDRCDVVGCQRGPAAREAAVALEVDVF